MPLPRWLGRFNVRVTNRILGPIVYHVPGFGRVVHVGRRTGRLRRTPMMVFRPGGGDQAVFALTYGPETEWVRNVLAAGECRFESARASLVLTEPRLVRDRSRRLVPRPARWALALLRADHFMLMRVVSGLEGGVPHAGALSDGLANDAPRDSTPPLERGPGANDAPRDLTPPLERGPGANDALRDSTPPVERGPGANDAPRDSNATIRWRPSPTVHRWQELGGESTVVSLPANWLARPGDGTWPLMP